MMSALVAASIQCAIEQHHCYKNTSICHIMRPLLQLAAHDEQVMLQIVITRSPSRSSGSGAMPHTAVSLRI